MVRYALARGVALIAASGNSGREERYYPAAHEGVIAVGAIEDDATPASFSTRGAHVALFAKLYAKSHVRADRWYKLGRTMLYGRLEDETPFSSVRRFVEYEDYTLRMLGDYGFETPEALGVVEITLAVHRVRRCRPRSAAAHPPRSAWMGSWTSPSR